MMKGIKCDTKSGVCQNLIQPILLVARVGRGAQACLPCIFAPRVLLPEHALVFPYLVIEFSISWCLFTGILFCQVPLRFAADVCAWLVERHRGVRRTDLQHRDRRPTAALTVLKWPARPVIRVR
ncbi:hypothetical protein CRV24_009554 [Beauveria bassiana]|nr:hypothetical protein CRV24_009554 [Beauveria bassiana]